jgi:hypothetical protein
VRQRHGFPGVVEFGLASLIAVPVILYLPRSFDTLSTAAAWVLMLACGAVFGLAAIGIGALRAGPARAALIALLPVAAILGTESGRPLVGRASMFIVVLSALTVVSVRAALVLRPVRASLRRPPDLGEGAAQAPPRIHTVWETPRGLIAATDVEWPGVEQLLWEYPLRMPPKCARCLAPAERTALAAQSLRAGGVTRHFMVRVPYCNRCHAADVARDRRATRTRFVVAAVLGYAGFDLYREGVVTFGGILVLGGFILAVLTWIRTVSPEMRTNAVGIVLLYPSRVEFRFENRDYGRLVVAANEGDADDGPGE